MLPRPFVLFQLGGRLGPGNKSTVLVRLVPLGSAEIDSSACSIILARAASVFSFRMRSKDFPVVFPLPFSFLSSNTPAQQFTMDCSSTSSGLLPAICSRSSLVLISSPARSVRGFLIFLRISTKASQVVTDTMCCVAAVLVFSSLILSFSGVWSLESGIALPSECVRIAFALRFHRTSALCFAALLFDSAYFISSCALFWRHPPIELMKKFSSTNLTAIR